MRKVRAIHLIRGIAEDTRNAVPYNLTFKPTGKLSKKDVDNLQQSLEIAFQQWARTWIFPRLEELEQIITSDNRKAR